jgi:hypothetical protein
MAPKTARDWIERLGMQRHPEGGWFRETWRSPERIPRTGLPERYGAERSFSTAIYFLLEAGDFSALHTLRSEELWHFYAGAPLTVHVIEPDGTRKEHALGPDLDAGQHFQAMVPPGCVFGASVDGPEGFALVGCTVAPGFDFADFELCEREVLLAKWPQHRSLIERSTRR